MDTTRIRLLVLLGASVLASSALSLFGVGIQTGYGKRLTSVPTNSISGRRIAVETTSIEKTIGVLSLNPIEFDKNPSIRFFNQDGSLWYAYSLYENEGVPTRDDFRPFALQHGYAVLALKCVGRDRNRFEVVVNEAEGLTKFVKLKDRNLIFETWSHHILGLFAVDFNRLANPLRVVPAGRRNSIELPKDVVFRPVQISGRWLRIRWEAPRSGKSQPRIGFGWIRWRNDKELLIEPFYIS